MDGPALVAQRLQRCNPTCVPEPVAARSKAQWKATALAEGEPVTPCGGGDSRLCWGCARECHVSVVGRAFLFVRRNCRLWPICTGVVRCPARPPGRFGLAPRSRSASYPPSARADCCQLQNHIALPPTFLSTAPHGAESAIDYSRGSLGRPGLHLLGFLDLPPGR